MSALSDRSCLCWLHVALRISRSLLTRRRGGGSRGGRRIEHDRHQDRELPIAAHVFVGDETVFVSRIVGGRCRDGLGSGAGLRTAITAAVAAAVGWRGGFGLVVGHSSAVA